ncbi:MAG: DUF2760 domain-containing protein [Aureliella sp.]
MALGVAFRAFFAALLNRASAERLKRALSDATVEKKLPTPDVPATKTPVKPTQPIRSEALTLLSTLQRESRLLDLVHESLDEFDDAQIGAAAREVLRDCNKSLTRMFAIEPLAISPEGEIIPLAGETSPARLRRVGKSQGNSGTVAHRGWQATRCELPSWSGQASDVLIIAPVEVDVQ